MSGADQTMCGNWQNHISQLKWLDKSRMNGRALNKIMSVLYL